MRTLAPVLVAAPPSGARICTRLRLNADEQVLRVVGQGLGRLAGQDLNRRGRLGRGPDQRADRKRATRVTGVQWRERWAAERLFLTADGEADKAWGNQTIRVHPDEQWLQLRLPSPLAHLSNTPGRAATYRLSCPVAAVLAARPSAARWRAYRPERSGSCWWAWPPTPTCGWWRWIPAGPRSGASATGKRHSPPRPRPRSPCHAITPRQW